MRICNPIRPANSSCRPATALNAEFSGIAWMLRADSGEYKCGFPLPALDSPHACGSTGNCEPRIEAKMLSRFLGGRLCLQILISLSHHKIARGLGPKTRWDGGCAISILSRGLPPPCWGRRALDRLPGFSRRGGVCWACTSPTQPIRAHWVNPSRDRIDFQAPWAPPNGPARGWRRRGSERLSDNRE